MPGVDVFIDGLPPATAVSPGDLIIVGQSGAAGYPGTAITRQALVSQLPVGNYTAPYTGAVTRTVASKLTDVVSALDFGAIGDGTTDDTAAINEALTNGGSAIFLPPGKYRVTSPLTVPANVILYGNDINAYYGPTDTPSSEPVTQIVADNSGSGFPAGSAVLTLGQMTVLRGFTVQSVTGVDAIVNTGGFVILERVTTRYGRYGLNQNAIGLQAYGCRFSEATSHGAYLQASTTDSTFLLCFFAANGGDGMQMLVGIKNTIAACTFEWNSLYGLEMFNCSGCAVSANQIDRNSQSGLFISLCDALNVTGNVFRRNSAAAAATTTQVQFGNNSSRLMFSGNNYVSTYINDNNTGAIAPLYTYQVDVGLTVTASQFAERSDPSASGTFADTYSAVQMMPQFIISPEATPGPYANDAAAEAAGIPVGADYKNTSGTFNWRVS